MIVWLENNPLSVTESNGKAVHVAAFASHVERLVRGNAKLPPGKEVEYDELALQLNPSTRGRSATQHDPFWNG